MLRAGSQKTKKTCPEAVNPAIRKERKKLHINSFVEGPLTRL